MLHSDRIKSIFDVFSRRASALGAEYKPSEIADRLRNRIILLYRDVVSGQWGRSGDHSWQFWPEIHNSLQHLCARPRLSSMVAADAMQDTLVFLTECETSEFLDFIELSFKARKARMIIGDGSELVDALNELFRIEQAPYQLTPMVWIKESTGNSYRMRLSAYPQIVRSDDDAAFAMGVAPSLGILTAPHFEAANIEFREAMEEYRKGDYGDCLTKCASALESVLKVLCKRNKWPIADTVGVARLLEVVVGKTTLDSFFTQPLMLIATIRNRLSKSHGGGSTIRTVERHVAEYAVTSTAAAIILLIREAGR